MKRRIAAALAALAFAVVGALAVASPASADITHDVQPPVDVAQITHDI